MAIGTGGRILQPESGTVFNTAGKRAHLAAQLNSLATPSDFKQVIHLLAALVHIS